MEILSRRKVALRDTYALKMADVLQEKEVNYGAGTSNTKQDNS